MDKWIVKRIVNVNNYYMVMLTSAMLYDIINQNGVTNVYQKKQRYVHA